MVFATQLSPLCDTVCIFAQLTSIIRRYCIYAIAGGINRPTITAAIFDYFFDGISGNKADKEPATGGSARGIKSVRAVIYRPFLGYIARVLFE